jgi:hypothetical protein
MLDELALVVGADPLTFRLAHLRDERGRAVLQAAADAAGWGQRGPRDSGIGYGMATRGTRRGRVLRGGRRGRGRLRHPLRRLTVAADVGRVVNPDGVRNQLEGGAVQSASWTLKERVRFDRMRITSDDWESYPILRFSEAPAVNVVVLEQPDLPSVGSGRGSTGAGIGGDRKRRRRRCRRPRPGPADHGPSESFSRLSRARGLIASGQLHVRIVSVTSPDAVRTRLNTTGESGTEARHYRAAAT